MGLETATYISGLNATFPLQNDLLKEADDHLRLIKSTIKNTFPNINNAVTATPAELNLLVGVTAFPSVGGADTQVQFNSLGVFTGSGNLTFDGTRLTAEQINVRALLALGSVDTDSEGIAREGNAGSAFFSGGTGATAGAILTNFGGGHASRAGDWQFNSGTDGAVVSWDNDVGDLRILTGVGAVKTLTGIFTPTQVTLGNFVLDVDQSVGAPEDDFVLAYNNAAGEIRLRAQSGGGNVQTAGAPLNNQVAVFTGATTIEGEANLTFDSVQNWFTASDGTNQLQWQSDQLILTKTSNDYFEARQAEMILRSAENADPTAGQFIDSFFRFESQDGNLFFAIGTNSAFTGGLEIRNEAWGEATYVVGRNLAGTESILMALYAEDSGIAFLEDFGAPMQVQGNAGDLGAANGAAYIQNGATLYFEEIAAAQVTLANHGQVWVRDDGILMYTNPSGTDINLTALPSPSTEYCPGYVFTFVDVDTFQVNGVDVTNLLSVGRRLKFIDGASEYFGVVSSRDYNTTSPGNTTINMTMEGTDVLTSTITEFCLITSATAWSPITDDPFSGGSIRAITSGAIGGTKWWVAVGDGGKLATSTNAGANWTLRTSGTTQNLNDVAYNPDDQSFLAVGDAGEYTHSTNGSTWTANTTKIPTAVGGTGNHDMTACGYWDGFGDYWVWAQNDAFPQYGLAYSSDDTVTWTFAGGSVNTPQVDAERDPPILRRFRRDIGEADILCQIGEDVYFLTDSRDAGATLAVNTSGEAVPYCYIGLEVSGTERRVTGRADGKILSDTVDWDDGTTGFGSDTVRAAAESISHDRVVFVGDNAKIGTAEYPYAGAPNALTMRENGFDPTAHILDVHWDAGDGIFIAVANNGQICRSSNGIN